MTNCPTLGVCHMTNQFTIEFCSTTNPLGTINTPTPYKIKDMFLHKNSSLSLIFSDLKTIQKSVLVLFNFQMNSQV